MKRRETAKQTKSWLGVGTVALLLAAALMPRTSAQAVREIDDSSTGVRWLLMRDTGHPGGPGRMALAANAQDGGVPGRKSADLKPGSAVSAGTRFSPVIRAGDGLIVEEHTPVADARLEAQALNAAALGSTFRAKLKIGGKIVQVVAAGPGRATLVPKAEVRP